MNIEIVHGPGNSAAKVMLAPGESCTAESGAMIAMSGDMQIETSTHKKTGGGGGILKAAKRLLSGESIFRNHFTAGRKGGEVFLAATLAGDMMQYDLRDETLIVQAGSYVCCDSSIDMDMGWQGFKSFFSGESVFWLKLSGTGPLVINAFGAIYPIEVNGEYIVDTGHIVAFNESLDFDVTKAGGSWMSAILGGEGLVCRFKGHGTVWCQSHNSGSFGATLGPMLKAREG
ncbi:MAG: TIGR00266 family protein [Planctomycetota bacterium]|nr:TIGR00266 family protein [Planctomycetota bacterium]MDA1139001.1 TIGR00266 family protein [Planctomycetota bacterium]